MVRIGFRGVAFDDGFAAGVRADGVPLRFQRQERALLDLLAGHPQRLFSREDLFVALGSRGSDRNVDFVINRLRRKLGDTGRERRFISTQYGEGYVWVAPPEVLATAQGFILLGPVRGMADARTEEVLRSLQAALQGLFGRDRPVVFASDGEAATDFHFSLDASFHAEPARLTAGFVLRQEPDRETIAAYRESFGDTVALEGIEALAAAIAEAIWKRLALGPTAAAVTDPPLHLRMQAASVLLDPPGAAWRANGEQLARLRAQTPDDPRLAIMWAMHLFGSFTVAPNLLDGGAHARLLDEIEPLVLGNLAAVRDDPVMALAASKLLLGVHRGHVDLAESLANAAFEGSAAFAAALPMLGQIRAYRGELAEACRLYDEGLQLCESGSPFEIYIQILKATALIAREDYAGAEAVYHRVVEIMPEAYEQLGLLFLPPGDEGLARTLAGRVDRASLDQARAAIAYLHRLTTPYFPHAAHAANILRGPLTHLVRQFGEDVAPPEVWREIPAELHYLRAARV